MNAIQMCIYLRPRRYPQPFYSRIEVYLGQTQQIQHDSRQSPLNLLAIRSRR